MDRREKALAEREKALAEREKAVEERERRLDPISEAVRDKKEQWYSKVRLSLRQMNAIIYVLYGLLALVAVLIILEATGVFRIG